MAFKSGAEWNGNAGGRKKNALKEYLQSKKELPEELYNGILNKWTGLLADFISLKAIAQICRQSQWSVMFA